LAFLTQASAKGTTIGGLRKMLFGAEQQEKTSQVIDDDTPTGGTAAQRWRAGRRSHG